MKCSYFEEQLSQYLERSLSPEDTAAVAEHLRVCENCSALLGTMESVLSACSTFQTLEPDLALLDRILMRTSGRPHTKTVRELLNQYCLRPMLTPRFALGSVIALLFSVLLVNLMLPRLSTVASYLSPRQLFFQMDRGIQQLYGEGLKAYDKKNELQAQFTFLKNNVFNRLTFMMEQLDVPAETRKKPEQQQRPNEKAPGEKSSLWLLPA
jgi:hypothetical protein